MNKAALKLVDRPSFYHEEGEFWGDTALQNSHSLHYSLPLQGATPPEVASFLINRFSRRGETVLDQFCGSGATPLEAVLQGRVPYASDHSQFLVQVTEAKLHPVDIPEVTLRLQLANLRRPVAVEVFRSGFHQFYSIDTFRELVALKQYLGERKDRASRFIQLVASSLLHGHSAGYFSVYSFPQFSISPDEQERLNVRRSQVPDHRPTVPRILRRTAMILQDGIPSLMRSAENHLRLATTDARDLSYVPSGSVGLIVTAPPLPGESRVGIHQWLRLWFADIDPARDSNVIPLNDELEWRNFMNEVLLEAARVVRSGGRAALVLREVASSGQGRRWLPDQVLIDLIESELSKFWDAECLLVHRGQSHMPKKLVGGVAVTRNDGSHECRMLVLRRR